MYGWQIYAHQSHLATVDEGKRESSKIAPQQFADERTDPISFLKKQRNVEPEERLKKTKKSQKTQKMHLEPKLMEKKKKEGQKALAKRDYIPISELSPPGPRSVSLEKQVR